MKIGKRKVGEDQPCFIIAEAGINPNGDYNIACDFVDIAKASGADAIKFQTFKETELPFKNLTYPEFIQLKDYCDRKNIMFLSTPHSLSAIDFLSNLVPAFKIASPHIINDYFVRRVCFKQKPIIASTGSLKNYGHRASPEEVEHFLRIVNNRNLILLYCESNYPCYSFGKGNFLEFKKMYRHYPVGYSSHSKEIEYSLDAVSLGACVIEQHITLDDDYDCPDKKVSINPNSLYELVKEVRNINESTKKDINTVHESKPRQGNYLAQPC